MITQLPEALMILIISYLPFIDAVRLCSLSKQWFHLWVFSRILEFDENRFMESRLNSYLLQNGRDAARILKMKKRERKRFIEYVHTTLPRLMQPELLKFSLHVHYESKYDHYIEKWIKLVLTTSVKELNLNFSDEELLRFSPSSYGRHFELPDFPIENKSLEVLTLNFCNLRRFSLQKFNALRSLSLTRTCFTMDIMCNLKTSCPLLEVLSLVNCRIVEKLHIPSCIRLEKLIIRGCMPLMFGIEISAPKLKYLDYFGQIVIFEIGKLEELVEVVLDFGLQFHFIRCSVQLCDILKAVKHAKSLTICSYLLKVLSSENPLLYKLPTLLLNLRKLTAKMSMEGCELPGILCLLRSAPNLESLSIQIGFSRLIDVSKAWQKKFIAGSLCSHFPVKLKRFCAPLRFPVTQLKTIKIDGFTGSCDEMKLLKILLRNAGLLRTVIIIPQLEPPSSGESSGGASFPILSAVKELERLERASPQVQIMYQSVFTMQSSMPIPIPNAGYPLNQHAFSHLEWF